LKGLLVKIAINLLPFVQRSGIECYTENLLAELLGSDDEFYIYYRDKLPLSIPSENSNIHLRKVVTRIPMSLYMQLIFPFTLLLEKIDIVLSTCPTHPIILSRRNVVIIYDCCYHAFPENAQNKLKLYLIKFMCWSAIRFAKRVVTVSNFSVGEIERVYKLNEGTIENISAGVPSMLTIDDDSAKNTLSKYDLEENGYIFFVASVQPHKNLLSIIGAFLSLSIDVKGNTKLVIAGRLGSMEKRVMDLVMTSGVSDSVIVLGFVDEIEKICLIRESIGVCLASLYEGFGIPILEAQSMGVPILTSNICSMSEVVGDSGILVDPYDETDISRGMKDLIQLSYDERISISGLAEINLERFSWKKCAERLMAAVKN
jgi:glycosyltransferase involved in cell wall biosynthesis